MKFEQKLKKNQQGELWQEYCGFLDLSLDEYMCIQNRLMDEQIKVWSNCPLGQKLLDGRTVSSVEDFRNTLPLTTYVDYADMLLSRSTELLPDTPVVWIETTWEGGRHPIKVAPYTKSMLDVYQNNVVASLIQATSTQKGDFSVAVGDKTLYGFAPLPYATGLLPLLFNEEITLKYLPSLESGNKMSFGERNRVGFSQALRCGLDLVFGMSSVVSYMTESFIASGSKSASKSSSGGISMPMLTKFLKASYKSKRDGTPLKPKDLFKLKGFVCAGTDAKYYKEFLTENWGLCPMEIAAGTEPTLIGTETWSRNGLVFFPDACFYEFIPEEEMLKNMYTPSYEPRTYLMDELLVNHNYELVISVLKGGAFARYRVGDMYRCVGIGGWQSGTDLPRLEFLDRVPSVIDIGGFTRITESSINDVIQLSGLQVHGWVAGKEYNQDNRPFLHMYVEMEQSAVENGAISKKILAEHLGVYFKYFDSDYSDLKRLLGMEPLVITILRIGTMDAFHHRNHTIRRINPSQMQIAELLRAQCYADESLLDETRGSVAR